jgi:hypothetical protein
MRIVVDVGCAKYGGDESIPYLVEEYQPDVLLGFDGSASLYDEPNLERIGNALVIRFRIATWTFDGVIPWKGKGLGGHVAEKGAGADRVQCVDLATVLGALADRGDDVILKMDAEGAEYVLLPHLTARGVDSRLERMVVEWHCADCGIGGNGRHRDTCTGDHEAWTARRKAIEDAIACPNVAEWNR